MHELPCNRLAVRRKWIKFIQFKRAAFLAAVRQKMLFFFSRAFITPRSQFQLHHRSQRTLTETVSKITPNLALVL